MSVENIETLIVKPKRGRPSLNRTEEEKKAFIKEHYYETIKRAVAKNYQNKREMRALALFNKIKSYQKFEEAKEFLLKISLPNKI